MRSLVLLALAVTFAALSSHVHAIDSRVVRVRLPDEDIAAEYTETAPSFTVRLQAKSASVQAETFYIGNGSVAVELRAHSSQGFVFQGELLAPPHVFKKGATVKVLPGYKRVEDLTPGVVYVELPGVTFELPEKK
jgi:hypothetical protein